MAIKERYIDNVGYLFKRKLNTTSSTLPTYEEEGIPYRYNDKEIYKTIGNPISSMYKKQSKAGQQTDTQIDFAQGDKVSDYKNPNEDEYSLITNIKETPINAKGNRYRTIKLVSRELELN